MPAVDNRRAFSFAERKIVFDEAGGACTQCGAHITLETMHCDHVVPHSKGGPTDIDNAAALCARCNLTKGNSTTARLTTDTSIDALIAHLTSIASYAWQVEAINKLRAAAARGDTAFFAGVAPSAGKTRFGLAAARLLQAMGVVDLVIIFSPFTNTQVDGWGKDAEELFEMPAQYEGASADRLKLWAKKSFSISLTYAWLSTNPDNYVRLHRALQKSGLRVLIIADEVHHGCENNVWGKALTALGKLAAFRIGLSGTPFRREADAKIPFLNYGRNGRAIPHFDFSHGQAVAADVIANPRFCFFNAAIDVEDRREERTIARSYVQPLTAQQLGALHAAATTPGSNTSRGILRHAHDRLMKRRRRDPKGSPRSAGLAIMATIEAAEAAAHFINHELKAKAVIVHSRDLSGSDHTGYETDDAQQRINLFRDCEDAVWIVSVGMVSEGVNIPRLKVLAYLTHVVQRLSFYQAVGRITRRTPGHGENQRVWAFMPAHREYIKFAREIGDTIWHALGASEYELREEALDIEESEDGLVDLRAVSAGASEDLPEDAERAAASIFGTQTCPHCGTENSARSTHCGHCHNRLVARDEPPQNTSGPRPVSIVDIFSGEARVVADGQEFTEEQLADAITVWFERLPEGDKRDEEAELMQAAGRSTYAAEKLLTWKAGKEALGETTDDMFQRLHERAEEIRSDLGGRLNG